MAWDTFKAALKRHCEGGIAIPEKVALRPGAPSKEKMIGKYEGIGDDGKRETRTKANWPGHRRIIDKSGLEHRGNIKAIDQDTAESADPSPVGVSEPGR